MHLDRYWSETFREHGHKGRLPLSSDDHLAWVRSRPCLVSKMAPGREGFLHIDAHHVIPRARGLNDFVAIPLRHDIHLEGHQIGWRSFEGKYAIDIKEALIATLCERIWELEHDIR